MKGPIGELLGCGVDLADRKRSTGVSKNSGDGRKHGRFRLRCGARCAWRIQRSPQQIRMDPGNPGKLKS